MGWAAGALLDVSKTPWEQVQDTCAQLQHRPFEHRSVNLAKAFTLDQCSMGMPSLRYVVMRYILLLSLLSICVLTVNGGTFISIPLPYHSNFESLEVWEWVGFSRHGKGIPLLGPWKIPNHCVLPPWRIIPRLVSGE